MRKLLPSFMGIVTLMWVIGGTIWMSRKICNAAELQATSTMTTTTKEGNQINQDVLPLSSPIAINQSVFVSKSIQNAPSSFQGLNLYFTSNKYRFKITPELNDYFSQLKSYLSDNPQSKIKVSVFKGYTEGGDVGKRRLLFLENLLSIRNFDLKQFEWKIVNDKNIKTITSKNQRIEIRKI